ncbi:MAG: Ig domain-containing protein, partial [Verrucomicrobiae bacterium]|nr:Ig domain-containing protein [Verrucomicrobiae bacterium]
MHFPPQALFVFKCLIPTLILGCLTHVNPSCFASSPIWGTYYGGSGDDRILSVHTDGARIAVGGITTSPSGIATPGVAQSTHAGSKDGFVAVFDGSGKRQWATYLGGWAEDEIVSVKIDGGGVYAVGNSRSTNFIPNPKGGQDGFVSRLNPSNGQEIWRTVIGGNGDDTLFNSDTFPGGIIVVGSTLSTNLSANGYQKTHLGGLTGFAQIINSNGGYGPATYYGGWGQTQIQAVKASNGEIYIAGSTTATEGIASQGALQSSHPANGFIASAFIARLGENLNTRAWGTYIGNDNQTIIHTLALDASKVYAGGYTDGNSLPQGIKNTPHQGIKRGWQDGFVVALNRSNGSEAWWNFIGGEGQEAVFALHSDGSRIYAAGVSDSISGVSTDARPQGSGDGFIVAYSSDGNRSWGQVLGGHDQDTVFSIVQLNSDLIVAGVTRSQTNIVSGSTPHQSSFGGGYEDGFIMRRTSSGADKSLKIAGPTTTQKIKVGPLPSPIQMSVIANGPASRWEILNQNWQAYSLQINDSGRITGEFYQPGTYTVQVVAYNSNNEPSNIHSIPFEVLDNCPSFTRHGKQSFTTGEYIEISISSNKKINDWLISPSLPLGLTLNKNEYSASITGILSTSHNQKYTLTAKTNCGEDSKIDVQITVAQPGAAPCTISGNTITVNINGTVGQSLNYTELPKQLSSSCGSVKGWRVWSGSTLPEGLSLHSTTGAITGTPRNATTGHYAIIEAWNDFGHASIAVNFHIAAAPLKPCLNQTSTQISGTVGQPITPIDLNTFLQNSSSCGSATSWLIVSGNWPNGISLSGSTISGTPSNTGNTTITLRPLNQNVQADTTLQITFNIAPNIQRPCFSQNSVNISGTVGTALQSIDLRSYLSNGTNCGQPTNWQIVSGSLPQGLTHNNGVISGTPTAAVNNQSVTLRASNSAGSADITLTFNIATNVRPPCFNQTIAEVGGTVGTAIQAVDLRNYLTNNPNCGQPSSWQIVSGTLPSGLTHSNGQISGTPTSATTAQAVTFRASNSAGQAEITVWFTFTPRPTRPPCFNLSNRYMHQYVTQGQSFNYDLKQHIVDTSPNCGPATSWSVVSGQLPGVTLNNNGVLSGTWQQAGFFSLVVRASNADGNETLTLEFTVASNLRPPCFRTTLTGVESERNRPLV